MEFTPRQIESLKIIAEGWSWSELARRQGVTLFTARTIYRFFAMKLEAKSGIELAEKARKILGGDCLFDIGRVRGLTDEAQRASGLTELLSYRTEPVRVAAEGRYVRAAPVKLERCRASDPAGSADDQID